MKPNICKYCQSVDSHFSFQCALKPKKVPKEKSITYIKPFSDKKLKELAIYRKERDKFLKAHPKCQFPGCESTEVTLHHSEGRIGIDLIDATKFKSLCWPHHSYCEEHPAEAIKLGLSGKRLNKRS